MKVAVLQYVKHFFLCVSRIPSDKGEMPFACEFCFIWYALFFAFVFSSNGTLRVACDHGLDFSKLTS